MTFEKEKIKKSSEMNLFILRQNVVEQISIAATSKVFYAEQDGLNNQ
jgi:hypothetical protein